MDFIEEVFDLRQIPSLSYSEKLVRPATQTIQGLKQIKEEISLKTELGKDFKV